MPTDKAYRDAVAFFVEHAGYSYNPETETRREGSLRSARELADAEEWLFSQPDYDVTWERDECYNPNDYDVKGMPDFAWGCVMKVTGKVTSLWAITFSGDGFPEGDPYHRVVVAELAHELMS